MPASYTGMQRLAFSSTLGLPQAQTLSHCRTAQRGQRHLRLVCPAGSAVADAPPKRKPGRPKKKVTEEPSPATELSPSTEPSPATEAAAAKPKKTKKSKKTAKPDSDKEEVPVVTAIKAPWDNLSAEEIARQQAELEPLQRAREAAKQEPAGKQKWRARESQYNKFVYRDPAWLEMESKLLTETKFGWMPKIGYHGKGQPQWWSLHVPSQKRMKAVAQFMALEVEGLPHLETEPDEPRLFETWLPSKVIKAYSLRSEKMGTKTVKWALGQVMLVKAVMDQELYDLIDNNIYVDKFNDSDTITDRNGVTHTVPKPCTAEDLDKIQTWLDSKEVLTKEEVMLETFGYTDENSVNQANNRMDMNEDYVEQYLPYDDDDDYRPPKRQGAKQPAKLRRYKDDTYRGSYNNPSNWYRGASEAEAGAGQRTETAMNMEHKEEARRRAGKVPREEVVGQTARAEARQEARRGSAQDRKAARSSTAWDTVPSNSSEPRRGQKQPGDTRFDPRDWRGSSSSSSSSSASSSRRSPQQQPNTKAAVPSGRSEGSWQDGNKTTWQDGNKTTWQDGNKTTWKDGSRNTWQDGNKPSAAGVPGLDEEAGLDDWEPTGAGRKGWYNPQSSSSSASAGKEAGRVDGSRQNPQSGRGDRRTRQEAPSVSTGQINRFDRNQRQKESYKADWSQQQAQPGSPMEGQSADYDTQLQKPVLQGRAKEMKEQPRELRQRMPRSHDLPEDPSYIGKRGAAGKSRHDDPIQELHSVKLTSRPSNWIRSEDSADADAVPFEMPNFEHLEGDEWAGDSLQFNNVANAPSGSHLDQWRSEGQDWRTAAQSPSQQTASTSGPKGYNPFPEGTDEPAATQGQSSGVAPPRDSSAQQSAAAFREDPTSPQSAGEPNATPSNAVSWDTGGFDFTDMNTGGAEGPDSGTGAIRNNRVQSRADTRQPARERKQGRSQGPRGRGVQGDLTQQSGAKGSSGQQGRAPRDTKKPDADFESFWDQF